MIMPVEQKKNDVNTVYKINGTIKKTNVHYECPKRIRKNIWRKNGQIQPTFDDRYESPSPRISLNSKQNKLRGPHQDVL